MLVNSLSGLIFQQIALPRPPCRRQRAHPRFRAKADTKPGLCCQRRWGRPGTAPTAAAANQLPGRPPPSPDLHHRPPPPTGSCPRRHLFPNPRAVWPFSLSRLSWGIPFPSEGARCGNCWTTGESCSVMVSGTGAGRGTATQCNGPGWEMEGPGRHWGGSAFRASEGIRFGAWDCLGLGRQMCFKGCLWFLHVCFCFSTSVALNYCVLRIFSRNLIYPCPLKTFFYAEIFQSYGYVQKII